MCPGLLIPNSDSFNSILLKFRCVVSGLKGTPGEYLKNHFCFVDLFFPFCKKLVILIVFVVKEIEVHDGTVGGRVSSLLFLLASPRPEI